MHELSLVAELVDACVRSADDREIAVVRVRHASTIGEATVRQAFEMLTAGGPLAGVRLETEEFDIEFACSVCHYGGVLDHDHSVGHLRVCPACGSISNDAQPCELELVECVASQPAPAGGP
jgi:Zn finger protein HypA/HybF involved in hydrogenase expression